MDVIAAGKAMNEALDGRGGGSKENVPGQFEGLQESKLRNILLICKKTIKFCRMPLIFSKYHYNSRYTCLI